MKISQEAGQMTGIPISFRIFQFIVIRIVKVFGIVHKEEIDIFSGILFHFQLFWYSEYIMPNVVLDEHKLELISLGEISDMQMTSPLWLKAKRN